MPRMRLNDSGPFGNGNETYHLVNLSSGNELPTSNALGTTDRPTNSVNHLPNTSAALHDQDFGPQNRLLYGKGAKSRHNERSPHDNARSRGHSTAAFSGAWWKEILACILMVGALFAIVGVLYPHQGRPLPEWRYGISINALISIFTTILKATSVAVLAEGLSQKKWLWFSESRPLQQLTWYDEASRSVFGCLRLIFVLNWRDLIATIGAITVVLGIAVDPFTQQLVQYYNCPQTVVGGIATIPRTNIYGDAGGHTGAGIWPVSTAMYAFIDQGLFNPQSVQTPFGCPTGNCSFTGTYSSVGWCASCKDMTDQVKIVNVTVSEEPDAANLGPQTVWFMNTTLPSGTYASYNPFEDSFSNQHWFTINSNYTTGDIDLVLAAQNLPGSKSQDQGLPDYFAYLASGCKDAWTKGFWGCTGYGAATCRLDPCVRTYQASVVLGKLEETLVAQYTNMFLGKTASGIPILSMADASCVNDTNNRQRLREVGVNITDTSTMIPYPAAVNTGWWTQLETGTLASTGSPILNGSDLNLIPARCIYDIEYPTIESMTSYLSTYLSGWVGTSNNFDSFVGDPQQIAIFNNSYVNAKSINDTFQSMAESISLRMRTYGYPSLSQFSKSVEGMVQRTETCVGVRWPFLIEPAIVVGLTLVFFVAMIVQTESRGNRAIAYGWKSSPLPLVFDGLEGTTGDLECIGRDADVWQMKSLATGNARLRQRTSGVLDEG